MNFKKVITIILLLSFFIILNPNIVGNAISSNNIKIEKEVNLPNILSMDSIKLIEIQLINSIQIYIKQHAPNSKLDPNILLYTCAETKFDIILAMSQAHIESHYGTKGIASRTNSVFNVGTYDDGTILYRYISPSHSIKPYVVLMNKNYLRNKTAVDLLKPSAFVDYRGYRYASFKYYEYRVNKVFTPGSPIIYFADSADGDSGIWSGGNADDWNNIKGFSYMLF